MNQLPQIHLPANATLQDGKYQILSVLGQGGFGITYLANHKVFGKVAVKELFLNSDSAKCSRENTTQKQVIPHFKPDQFKVFKDRFLEEAKTLYNLRGVKGVVNVHDIFEENGTVYFSMEYLKGVKLDDYVRARKQLTEDSGLPIVRSLAQSLAAIHKENVLHRDIKPANIIVGDNGDVHLIDFGIAKSYLEEEDETHTTFHSPRYSPPEQKIARSRMGTFSDIYSLGATAYYLFTGRLPQSLEERLLEVEDYRPPQFYAPSLSDATNNTIVKSLKLKDKERIQTAEEFLNSLSAPTVVNTKEEIALEISKASASTLENDKTKIDFEAVKNTPPKDDKTQIFSEDDKTIIISEPPKESLKNVITSPPGEVLDDRTVVSSIYQEPEVDHDKTVIDQPQPVEEEKGWKVWLRRNKKLIPIGLLVFLAPIIYLNIPPKEPDSGLLEPIEQPIPKYILNFQVKDSVSHEVLQATTTIGKNSDYLKINDSNIFHLELSDWDRFKNQVIKISHRDYDDLRIQVKDLINKDTSIFLIKSIIDDLPPDPGLLCKNLKDKWITEDGKKLTLNACETQEDGKNPKGAALFEKNVATWEAFKKGEKTYLKLLFSEDVNEGLEFQIMEPYRKRKTRLIISGENLKMIFKRESDGGIKRYDLVGQVFDQKGIPIPEAQVYIQNSKFSMTAMNEGRFYFEIKKEWNRLKDQNLIITHNGFIQKTIKIKDIVRSENYIVRLEPLQKNPNHDPGLGIPQLKDRQEVPPNFCDNLNGYWMHKSSGEVIEMRDCAGSVSKGNFIFNGNQGDWDTGFNEKKIVLDLSFNNGNSTKLIVENPSLPNKITLVNVAKRFKRKTIEEIFSKNVLGTYKDKNGNKLIIKNTTGWHGEAIYKGETGNFKRSGLIGNGDNASITFKSERNTYIFDLRNITIKGNTYLELLKKNGDNVKSRKKTKHMRVY